MPEMLDDLPHLRLNVMLFVIIPQEADHVPVLIGQLQFLYGRLGPDEYLRPVVEVDQIAFAVGQYLAPINP